MCTVIVEGCQEQLCVYVLRDKFHFKSNTRRQLVEMIFVCQNHHCLKKVRGKLFCSQTSILKIETFSCVPLVQSELPGHPL